jgi:acetolactate synthase regulatory subunit
MKKVIHADLNAGIDSLMRVLSVIRRKDYQISDIIVSDCCKAENGQVSITMMERSDGEAVSAGIQLEKIFSVSNVRITK